MMPLILNRSGFEFMYFWKRVKDPSCKRGRPLLHFTRQIGRIQFNSKTLSQDSSFSEYLRRKDTE